MKGMEILENSGWLDKQSETCDGGLLLWEIGFRDSRRKKQQRMDCKCDPS